MKNIENWAKEARKKAKNYCENTRKIVYSDAKDVGEDLKKVKRLMFEKRDEDEQE